LKISFEKTQEDISGNFRSDFQYFDFDLNRESYRPDSFSV